MVEEADDVGQGVDRPRGSGWSLLEFAALRADLPVIPGRGWCFGARWAEIGPWRAVGTRIGGYWPWAGGVGRVGGRIACGVGGRAALRADLPVIRRGGWCLAPGGGENGLCGVLGARGGGIRLGRGLSGGEPSGAGLARRRSTSAAVEGLAALPGLSLGLSPVSFFRDLPRASGGDVDGTGGLGWAVLLPGPILWWPLLSRSLAGRMFLAASSLPGLSA